MREGSLARAARHNWRSRKLGAEWESTCACPRTSCMRVRLSHEGGLAAIPGLRGPFEIDTSTLDPADAREVERLVEASRFFEQPESLRTSGGTGADKRAYTISVEDGGRR